MKILYITTISATMGFFKSFIEELIKEGHTVDIACNDSDSPVDEFYYKLGCRVYPILTSRSPFSTGNIKAIKQIRNIVKFEKYDIVHCHTPIAAAATRLACKPLRKDREHPVKVIYTAHGFHFYKGAPMKNWLIFYPIEKYCAKYTDVLITINKEDYERAKDKFAAGRIEYVPGVGIDVQKFAEHKLSDDQRHELRSSIGVPDDAIMLLSVGELNENKNHETVIRAVAEIIKTQPEKKLYYAIAGKGDRDKRLAEISNELGSADRVKLLGFRRDVIDLYRIADIFIHPSFREGLPVSVMEALASEIPVIGSKIRGNNDLIGEYVGDDCLFDPTNSAEVAEIINSVCEKKQKGQLNLDRSNLNSIDYRSINEVMKGIYEGITN